MDINHLLATHPVICRGDWPRDKAQLDWAVRSGTLVAVLPGVYASPDAAHDWRTRVLAVAGRYPNSVFTGLTAARLSWWPDAPMAAVTCTGYTRSDVDWLRASRRSVPVDLVVDRDGLRYTCPALSALESALIVGPSALDAALLRRVQLSEMHEAIAALRGMGGVSELRTWLHESRDTPWSPAERKLHKLLRQAGLTGWVGNKAMGRWTPDICFVGARVIIEVDGWKFHGHYRAFEDDRFRHSEIAADGWVVLRFTALQVDNEPEWVVATVKRALRRAPRVVRAFSRKP